VFQDSLTLRAYVQELQTTYPLPWFLQKASQIDEESFLLHLRAANKDGFLIFVSLRKGAPQFRLWHGSKPQAQPPSGFTMQLRKHLQGRPFHTILSGFPERSLRLEATSHIMELELIERQPLLFLLDKENKIVGGSRLGRSSERDLRRHRIYSPPPTGKRSALELSPFDVESIYLENPATWPQSLLKNSFGLSAPAVQTLRGDYQGLSERWKALWQRCQPGNYCAELDKLGRFSIWGDGTEQSLLSLTPVSKEPPGQERARLANLARLQRESKKLEVRLQKLEQDSLRAGQADRLQLEGELLLTFAHSLTKGSEHCQLPLWDGSGYLEIDLSPELSPQQQAQKCLKQAAKLRRSLPLIEERRRMTENQLAL